MVLIGAFVFALIPRSILAQGLVVRRYTDDQLEHFCQEKLEVVGEGLAHEMCPLAEINAHHAELAKLIKTRYGGAVQLQVIAAYHRANPFVTAENHVTNGRAHIDFYLAAFNNLYDMFKTEKDPYAEERIRHGFVVSILHEMEHLAYGYVVKPVYVKDVQAAEKFGITQDTFEARTWAITCESAIRPLLTHQAHIMGSDLLFYDKWVKCGKEVDSKAWRIFINNRYSLSRDLNAWKKFDIR